jgi:pyruvate,water dikinase
VTLAGAQHTRPLTDLRRADEPLFGGKSASLGELIAAGIPVPAGFAVASSAFSAPEGPVSAALRDAVRSAPVPDGVRAEIAAAYEALGAEPPVAVRSSALGEDSADATFAGQLDTYLWVRGADAVCHATRECWASFYNPEAISYRARVGATGQPAMGVTVQLMVDALASGVMFTCNPVSGDPSTVAVNASWGLGSAVVSGEVTPDEYRLSKVTGELLARTIGPKQVEDLPDPGGAGTVRAEVPVERREAACLDDESLARLVDVARRIERHFGGHQDVEWAIARDGELLVLQSRPVTARPATRNVAPQSALSLVMKTFGAKGES